MKKRGNIQKLTSFFLVFVMLLGVFMPTQTVFAEGLERVDTQITDFTVTTSSGEIPPDGFSISNALRIGISWDASFYQNNLKEGDYFNVSLPKEFIFPEDHSACNFDIKTPDGNDVVAKAVVTPDTTNGGGVIEVTFTKYVEDRYDIKGSMFLNANFNKELIKQGEVNVISVAIGSHPTSIEINVKPQTSNPINNETLTKWSRNKLFNGNVRWEMRINHKKGNLSNAIITDELSSEDGDMTGIHYIPDSFRLMEIQADEYGTTTWTGPAIDISNDVVLSDNNTKFSYRLGDISGKQYFLMYDTTYKPNIKLHNKVTLADEQETWVSSSSAVFAESGGQGQGDLISKIKIVKVDAENQQTKLSGAKFLITKLADYSTFTLTTNAEGEAISDKLIPGDYKIKEIEAPDNYVLNDTEYTVTVTSDKVCLKEITNEPIRKNIYVEKMWIGGQWSDPITAILKANGIVVDSHELSANNDWKHTFTGLRKYDEQGYEIQYSVEEAEKLPGYTTTYAELPNMSGETQQGFAIINTKNTIEVTVTKSWEGVSGEIPAIKLQLLKDGDEEGYPIELTNGTTTHKWTDLEKTDYNGRDYVYTVKEVGETNNNIQIGNNWYKVTYGGDQETGLTVNNKKLSPWTPMIPPTRDVKVTKVWNLLEGSNIPDTKIEVELYKDGEATGKKLELTKDNNWTGEFKNLEVADGLGSTNYYKYTVKEIGESGAAIQLDGKWYGVSYGGTMADGLTVTNKEKKPWTPMIPPTREINVTKQWKSHSGKTITAPIDKIIVELYKNGEATGKKVELNADNNWSATFKNIEVANGLGSTDYYQYTVKEIGENRNIIKINGKIYDVVYKGNMKEGFIIINEKEAPPTPHTPEVPNTPEPNKPEVPNNPTPNKPNIPNTPQVPSNPTPNNPAETPNTSITKTLPKTAGETNRNIYTWLMLASVSILLILGIRRRKHAK